jgi:hypothetical protein
MLMRHSLLIPLALSVLGALAGCDSDQAEAGPPSPGPGKTPEAVPLLLVDQAASLLPSLAPVAGAHAAFADLDGDGRPDIAQPTSAGLRVFWNGPDSFEEASATALPDEPDDPEEPAGVSLRQVVAGDFDADGLSDLLVLAGGNTPLRVLTHKTDRAFKQTTLSVPEGTDPRHAVAADLDADGDVDVVVTLAGEPTGPSGTPLALLFINDGTGKLANQTSSRLVAPGLAGYGVAVGDVDGDGAPDLVFAGDAVGHRLLLNDGRGYFRDASPDALPAGDAPGGRIPALGDVDGDGALDILVPSAKASQVLLNDGKGRFTDETAFVLGSQPGTGRVAVILDLDGDTFQDVVMAGQSSPFRVLRNDGAGRLFDYSANVVPHAPSAADVVSVGVSDLDGDGDMDLFVSRGGLARPWLLVNWYPEALTDADADGVPDGIDNCPDEPNPDQANVDSYPFSCTSGRDCKARTGCTLAVRSDSAYLLCEGPKTWEAARALCRSRGADLVIIETEEENTFLAESGNPASWIGLSDADTEGTFLWVNGKSVTTSSWNEGEPNDSGGVEDCVGLFTSGEAAGTWNDFDCGSERAFVCEDKTDRTPPDPGDACDVCPDVHDPKQTDTDGDGEGDACTTESP